MNATRAFFAGVFGAAIMSLAMIIARTLGVHMTWEMMLGSMITGATNDPTWLLGLVMHLFIGGVFGLIYGEIFERGTRRATVSGGAALGFIHAVLAGFAMAFIPVIHPIITEEYASPGLYMANLGVWAVVTFFAVHILYGMIMGALYEPRPVRASTSIRVHHHRV